jgi:hypothetical protein
MSYLIGNQLVQRLDLSPVSRTERKDKFRNADQPSGTPQAHLLKEHILILPTQNGNCRVVPRAPDSQRRRVFLDGLFQTKST